MVLSVSLKKSLYIDVIGSIVLLILAFVVAQYFDLFELAYYTTRRYEEYELDELFLLIFMLPVPLTWLSYRQFRRASLERDRRHSVEIASLKASKMQSLGMLAGGVAHELNNKLLPIIITSELVQKHMEPASPDFQRLELILNSAKHAQETVTKITDFSRSEKINLSECDVEKSWHALNQILGSICPKNISLSIVQNDFTGRIRISEGEFQGVIINLFSNSVDAIGNRSGKITLVGKIEQIDSDKTDLHLEAGPYAVITVEDNGPGMAVEHQNKIFDPFFTTKPPGQGVGLGLSIVFRCIEDAGGLILLEKNTAEGCQFKLYIPISGKK